MLDFFLYLNNFQTRNTKAFQPVMMKGIKDYQTVGQVTQMNGHSLLNDQPQSAHQS